VQVPGFPPHLTLARERAAASGAVLLAALVQLIIPRRLVLGPVLLLPLLEAALLAVLLVGRRRARDPHHPGLRALALALVTIMVVATVVATARLVEVVLTGPATVTAVELIRAGAGIWVTNVIAFALLYWEVDLGGPARRALPASDRTDWDGPDELNQVPDFLFPQYDSTRIAKGWQPTFADYLYTSFTNATAFSPTDTMPTRHRAKAMMATQSGVALITMAFLLARAVNVLK
jgi:hypothetical protein